MTAVTIVVEIASIPLRVKVPTPPPVPPKPRRQKRRQGGTTSLTCVHLSDAERVALNRAVKHYGLESRADAVRNAIRLAVNAIEAGAEPPGHDSTVGVRRKGEGVTVPNTDLDALEEAATKVDIPLSATIRWGCQQLIDSMPREARNGKH